MSGVTNVSGQVTFPDWLDLNLRRQRTLALMSVEIWKSLEGKNYMRDGTRESHAVDLAEALLKEVEKRNP